MVPLAMSRGPRPVAQLVISRPDGSLLVQGVMDRQHIASFVRKLAPLVPHDATWRVAGPDEEL